MGTTRNVRRALLLLAVGVGCSSFKGSDSAGTDGGTTGALDAAGGSDAAVADAGASDAGAEVAPQAFCAQHASALFCDDFEGNDLATRWPLRDTALGVVEIVDAAGANLGRSGGVLHVKATVAGAAGVTGLHLRRQLGNPQPVRVAYDLWMTDWTAALGFSTLNGGNVMNGILETWLGVNWSDKGLFVLGYTSGGFYDEFFASPPLTAPTGRWEHYELVVAAPATPGGTAHFEMWVGTPPVKVGEDTKPIAADAAASFSPMYAEIGFTRSNATPMPPVEAYYDNFVITSPP